MQAQFPVADRAGDTQEPRQLDVLVCIRTKADDEPGIAVRQDLFNDQHVTLCLLPPLVYPRAGPHPSEARYGLWDLRARRDQMHVRG